MSDGFLCGRHHGVVGCDDDDGDIGNLSTAGTHGSERLMTRGIKEGDATTIRELNIVGSNVLGDTTSLTSDDVGVADVVEQRSLTMVDMTHHRNDWSTWDEVVLIILLLADGLLYLCADIFGLESELIGNKIDGLCVESLVDRYHDTYRHKGGDDLCDADVHHSSQLADGNKLGEFEHLALLLLSACLLREFLLHSLTLLLTVLSTLLILVLLVGEACECLLYLTCHVLFVNLELTLVAVLVLLFLTTLTTGTTLLSDLIACGSYVDTFFANTNTLLALVLLGCLLLTLLLTFLLRLAFRTRTLVDCVKVYLSEDINLCGIEYLLLRLCCERSGWFLYSRIAFG